MNPPSSPFTVPFDGSFRVADTLKAMPLRWPEKSAAELALFDERIAAPEGEDS